MNTEFAKKVIKKTKVGAIKRIISYRNYNNILGLKGGFVNNIDQLELTNDGLYSLGNDPKILIRLNYSTTKMSIKLRVKSSFNDKIELFYSFDGRPEASFSINECYELGNTNGKIIEKNIIFPQPVKYIRIDLGNHKTKLELKDSIIEIPKNQANNVNSECYNEYTDILNNLSTAKDKNLVIITHTLNETGAPLLAFNIAKSFQEKGYNVFTISLSDGYLAEKYRENNLPLISLHQSPLSKEINNSKIFEFIVSNLKSKNYQNLLTNTIISGIATPFFKKYDFKIVSLIHEMGQSITTYDMKQGGRDINFYSDKIVFPDQVVQDEFFEIFEENIKKSVICPQGLYKTKEDIIPDYQSIYEKYNIPKNSKIILGSGYADYRKGIDLFLLAAQKLLTMEDQEEYHFIWAGKIFNEELREWYQLQFKKFGLENRFHNIDFIKDKKEYQNLVMCSDAFWLTSREDPYPSVMIEALEYNTPVLAFSNAGGANSLLSENRGILIPNFDVSLLAIKTKELLNNPNLQKKMLKNAQNYILNNLNFNNYISNLEKMFLKINNNYKEANLSVIIPNYNYQDYLPIRLKSIINQTIKPKEIIFLDDVSKDDSVLVAEEILKNAKKKYGIDYKIIKNTENNGCFKQWSKGIKLATQPFIWIAEADDYATENFVETLMPKFNNKDVVLAYCKSKVINEYGKVSEYDYNSYTNNLSTNKWESDFVDEGKIQVKKFFSQKNIIPNVSSAIIRKEATIGIEEELEKYKTIGDWFAYIYILKKGKIAYSCKCLNGHRRHTNSIIAKSEKSLQFIKEIISIKKYIIENYELEDVELNNLVLTIEKLKEYYENISKNNELRDLYISLIKKANEKRNKKNILIIIPDLNVGGGQTVAIRIANNMTKYYNVFLINAQPNLETSIMKDMISDDIKLLENTDLNDLRLYGEILNLKCVLSFIWWSDKLAYLAFGDTNIPLIISMHGCYEMLLHNPNVDEFFNTNKEDILMRANKIIYTAEKNKEIFKVLKMENDAKISKIDNGFVLDTYPKKNRKQLGIKNNEFVFGLVARAIPEKGYEEAIKALNILNKTEKEKAHLILLGSSDYIENLKNKYANEYIHFIDKFNLPSEWLGWEEIFDVGLLPSYFKSESLPTVIIEYLFLNKPVIATDIAEIKSMLQSQETIAGVTIPLKDGVANVNELVKEMKKMKNDKEYYNKLKNNTNKLSKRFDMDVCIDKYRKLIEECDEK